MTVMEPGSTASLAMELGIRMYRIRQDILIFIRLRIKAVGQCL
jgi:hypothetical protein